MFFWEIRNYFTIFKKLIIYSILKHLSTTKLSANFGTAALVQNKQNKLFLM